MHLYLLRHADADTVAPSDDLRFLSEKGMMQANRVA
jgi:phosphohistidine phosphatase SixA